MVSAALYPLSHKQIGIFLKINLLIRFINKDNEILDATISPLQKIKKCVNSHLQYVNVSRILRQI